MNKQFIQKIWFYIHRWWIGYFAPFLALVRMIRKRQFNFIHQIKVIYRYAYWKYFWPQNITLGIAKLMKAYSSEQEAKIEARNKASRQTCTQNWRPKKPRPLIIKKPLSVTHADQEYRTQWYANFNTRYLLIFVPSIQPQLILEVIRRLPNEDARFKNHGITSPLRIDAYFKIRVCFEIYDRKRWYLVRLEKRFCKLDITGDQLPSRLNYYLINNMDPER